MTHKRWLYERQYYLKNKDKINLRRRKWLKEWVKNNPEKSRLKSRKKEKRLKERLGLKIYYKRITETTRRWRLKYPERRKAQIAVFVAIRNRSLIRNPCHCGSKKVEAHHEDYSKPLKVKWLCKRHHIEADRKRRNNVR